MQNESQQRISYELRLILVLVTDVDVSPIDCSAERTSPSFNGHLNPRMMRLRKLSGMRRKYIPLETSQSLLRFTNARYSRSYAHPGDFCVIKRVRIGSK